jgi:hypothetical protein
MFNFLDNFGRSSSWRTVRNKHLKKFPTCAACGRTKNLEVHHIVPYQVDRSKELDTDNLITLCGDYCHFVFGHFMDYKSWNTNVVEDSKKYYMERLNRSYQFTYRPSHEKTIINAITSYIFRLLWWYD